jgi:hypothetical protein
LTFLSTRDAIPNELPLVWGMITIKKAKGVWGWLGNTGSMGTGNPVLAF